MNQSKVKKYNFVTYLKNNRNEKDLNHWRSRFYRL